MAVRPNGLGSHSLVTNAAAAAIDLDGATTRERNGAELSACGLGGRHPKTAPRSRRPAGHESEHGGRRVADRPRPPDYVPFVGMTCVGAVEAQRRNRNASDKIDQAGGYTHHQTRPTAKAGQPRS